MAVVGMALMRGVGVETPHGPIYGYTTLLSAGTCFYVQAAYPIAEAKAMTSEQASDAVNIIGCTQLGAIAISLAIANSIFINRAADDLENVLPYTSRTAVQAAVSGVDASVFQNLFKEVEQQVLQVICRAIGDVWTQELASACFSLLLCLLLKRERIPSKPNS